jgi:hypothetical protein
MVASLRLSFLVLALLAPICAEAEERCLVVSGFGFAPPVPKFRIKTRDGPGFKLQFGRNYSMSVSAFGGEVGNGFDEQTPLSRDGLLLKFKQESASGGMGGPEGHMDGYVLDNGKPVLQVSCHGQREDGVDPMWCLASLRTLKRCATDCLCEEPFPFIY